MSNLEVGDRVRIKGHWNWPEDCSGIVAMPPISVQQLAGGEPWHS